MTSESSPNDGDYDSQKLSEDFDSLTDDPLTSIKSIVDIDVQNKIETLYEEIIAEAKSEPILSLYLQNFEFIYQIVKALIENETKLKNMIELLRNNNEELNDKFAKAFKLSSIDQQTIAKLRADVENAWRSTFIANQKEKRTRETVSTMKLEISNLSKLVEQGVGLTMGQEYNIHQILKENEISNDENDKFKEEIEVLKKQLSDLETFQENLDNFKTETNTKLQIAEKESSSLRLEIQQENRKTERLLNDIKNLKELVQAKENEISQVNQTLESSRNEIYQYLIKTKDLQVIIDKLKKEIDIQTGRIQKLQQENDHVGIKNEAIIEENNQLSQKIKINDTTLEYQKNQIIGLQKLREGNERKIKQLDDMVKESNGEKLVKITENESLKKELTVIENDKNREKLIIDKLRKERDQRDLRIERAQNKAKKIKLVIRDREAERVFLEKQMNDFYREKENLENRCKKYEKNIQLKDDEINKMTRQLLDIIEEIKLKESSFSERDKKLNETNLKLEKMEHLYESVRSDRNMNAKELIELKEEKEGIKKQVIMLKNQQTLLVTSKLGTENDLKKIKFEYSTIEKERDNLKLKLNETQKQLMLSQQVNNKLHIEQKKLLQLLSKSDKGAKSWNKEIQRLIIERGILGSQLVRRNDEMSLLYEKISLFKSIMSRGENMYSFRLSDIKILKKEVLKLRKEISSKDKVDNLVCQLKNELRHSEKELLVERSKRTALEQIQGNVNIHRWRHVESCDPTKYELIVKVQQLQKRLILKYEEIAKLQIKFQEKDKIFFELKKYFARQPFNKSNMEQKANLDKKIKHLKVYFIFLYHISYTLIHEFIY
jgi:hypothetical protein